MSRRSSTYFANPEARAFLQRRVAAFGLISAILGGTALAFRVLIGLAFGFLREELTDPGFLIHAAAILPMIGIWLVARRGNYSVTAIHAIENTGIFLTGIGYIAMGLEIRAEVGADTITAFILAMVLFARSVFVPSSARRTTVLGILIGIPLVAAMYWHYLQVDLGIWRRFGYEAPSKERVAATQAVITLMWWTLTVGLSALASRVIHRLREEVRDIQSLGQYILERKLGEGAMGRVYRGVHQGLQRAVAVKLLKTSAEADPDLVRRFVARGAGAEDRAQQAAVQRQPREVDEVEPVPPSDDAQAVLVPLAGVLVIDRVELALVDQVAQIRHLD